MKLIFTLLLLTISTFSFAQKKHWENGTNNSVKKKIATRYSTLTKNKPATTYSLKRYNRKTKLLLESFTYLTKKALVKEGDYVAYHFNRSVKEKGVFKNNLKDGEWKTYSDDSSLVSITNFSKGLKNGKYEYFPKNSKKQGQYLNGKKDDVWKFYGKDGVKYSEVNYKNDLRNGTYTTYYSNGNIKDIFLYDKGKFIKTLKHLDINGKEIKETNKEDDLIYTIVEIAPEFPGGSKKMMQYLASHTKYPPQAIDNGIQGRVYISFVVDKDGSLINLKCINTKKIHITLEREAIRVVKSMPKWTPGRQRGKTIKVKYTVPINFRIR